MRHHNLQVTGSVVVNGLGVATASELTAYTASTDAKISTLQAFTASVGTTNTFTASTNSRLDSIETITASNIARINSLETTSASVDTTNTTQNTRLTNLESITGSLATTGSNTFIGTQTVTGSLFVSANLIVQGTSSLQNITASAVSIGTNIVNLNTANPAIRYAGLVIGDSGSIGSSGSFLYDSVQDEMIFVHRGANSTVTSSVLLMGPQTYDNIGSETYPTSNYIQKGTGNEHLVDSCIVDDGTTVCINANLRGSGTGLFSGNVTINNTLTAAQSAAETSAIIATSGWSGGCSNTIITFGRVALGVAGAIGYDDPNTGLYIGTTTNQRFAIRTNNTDRFVVSNSGISCFSNTICAPSFIGGTLSGTSATITNAGTACTVTDVLTLASAQTGGSSVCAGAGILFTGNNGATVARIYSRGNMNFNNGSDLVFQTQTSAGGGPQCTMVINGGSQNVGINVFNSNYKLEMYSPSSWCLLGLMGANGVNIDMVGFGTSLSYPQSRIQMNDDGFYGGNLSFFTKANGAQTNGLNERMTIKSTGITCFACQICAPYYAGGTSYTIDFLVVAGGGGGGGSEMSNGYGGGGGAGGGGGYLASSISVNCGSSYPIVVGTGGAGGPSCLAPNGSGVPGSPGTFSSAFGFIAIGGGGGAGDEGGSTFNATACQTGGSGGGQGGDGGGTRGIAVIGQGSNGGPNVSRSGGGGGGAVGTPGGSTGGAGRQWLDGNYYAGGGGGGGGGNDQTQYLGGVGGGGNGSRSYPGGGTSGEAGGQATAGTACTGGGGGGAGSGYLQGGMAGGSGIVIIRYFGSQRGSGGTISSSGGYTYHRFGANGTYTA